MQGPSSADTAASRLQADTDLDGQRGQVCAQPQDIERLTMRGLGGGLLPASPQPLLLEKQLDCTWEQHVANCDPGRGAAQDKGPKERKLLS